MASIAPTIIPIFVEEKRLVGRKNWATFKREVILQVGAKGLTGYLTGTISRPRPVLPTPPSPPVVVVSPPGTTTTDAPIPSPPPTTETTPPTPTQYYDAKPSIEEWDARDRYVASVMVSNTVDPVGLGIDENKPAARIWYKLNKDLDQKSEQLISIHEKRLHNRKMEEEGSFEDHVRAMRNLVKEARDVGATVSDAQFRSILLDSFPKSWDETTIKAPGTSSDDAIEYLEAIWINERTVESRNSLTKQGFAR